MSIKPDFWRDKRVFLTGHTGFKGSWLVLLLHRLGAVIEGYALAPPTNPNLFELAALGELVDSPSGDVRDFELLRARMAAFGPDIVLHMAAQSVVLRSYSDPIETYATNVMGTVNVLQAVRGVQKHCAVVNVTTDKVYENRGWAWGYREIDRLGGRDPYSNSKACAELVARAFHDSFFTESGSGQTVVALASARAGNVIGGGDWTPHQLVPDTIEALRKEQSVVLRHPAAIRPWQHVLDCLSGYMTLAQALFEDGRRFGGSWNFGPADEDMQPVSRVVELLGEHWGQSKPWVRDPGQHLHEEADLRLNSQLSNRELRWRGKLGINEALAWTAQWYKGHFQGESARRQCIEQIDRYLNLQR